MNTKKRKQQVDTKKIIIVLIVVVLVLFVAFLGLRYLKSKISQRFATTQEDAAKSAEVTVGNISTTVYGKGTLSNEDSETLTLPSTVEVTEIYVAVGDDIADGALLASVNASTVLQAMAEKQSEIDTIDEQIAEISEDTLDANVTAAVSGRVKQIFATSGDDVTEIMVKENALMTLSLDGYMSVQIENSNLERKDVVTVTTADGTSYEGSVTSVAGGVATILLTDDGPIYGETVTVTNQDNTEVGSGTLTIHEPVTVTGFAGTIDEISVEENQEVSAGDTLLTLTNVSYSANYATLLSERESLEKELMDLLTIYREGGVYAHSTGTITAVSEGTYTAAQTTSQTSSANSSNSFGFGTGSSSMGSMASIGNASGSNTSTQGTSGSDTTFSYCPSDVMQVSISVDETDILSLAVGQEASVYISSLSEDAYTGVVKEVGTTGSSSSGVTSYTAIVEVAKEEGMLSGMTATAYVTIEGTENATLIPVDALNKTSTTAYVYTTYDEETESLGGMVEVTIGLQNSQYVEIKEGLSEGDTVYYKKTESNTNGFDFSNFGGGSGMPSGGFGGGSGMPSGGFGGGSGMPSGGFGGGSGMPSRVGN